MSYFLEVTFIPPSKRSGGGLGIYQSICSLLANGKVDYIGPPFEEGLFDGHKGNLCVLHELEFQNSTLLDAVRFISKQISTHYYDLWKQVFPKIDWQKYDILHIESGRYFFVMREGKNHKKIIVRMHNIEADYAKRILFLQ